MTYTSARVLSGLFLLAVAPQSVILAQALAAQKPTDNPIAIAGQTVTPDGPRQSPAQPPRVSCQDGKLSIVAENSLMSSIFSAIRACTGVEINAPPGFGDDRTFVSLGPGPEREILNEFLSSTDFNFVIESSTSQSRKIQTVQLTERVKDTALDKDRSLAANLTLTPARRAWLASRSAGRPANYGQTTEDAPLAETSPIAPASTSDLSQSGNIPSSGPGPAAAGSPDSRADPAQPSSVPVNTVKDSAPSTASTGGGTAASNTTASLDTTKDPPRDSNATSPSASQSAVDTLPLATASDSSDPAQASSQPSVLQKQINQMQQLFEQRKQMNIKPSPDPAASTEN